MSLVGKLIFSIRPTRQFVGQQVNESVRERGEREGEGGERIERRRGD